MFSFGSSYCFMLVISVVMVWFFLNYCLKFLVCCSLLNS